LRLGILGGAFNPPHLGHLILAQEAHSQLGLDRVVFMPYAEPSHRVLEDDPGPEARFTMCEYAVGADARFAVSRLEIDRGGKAYTVDTLRELRARSAASGSGDDELFLVLGGDQAASLASWKDPAEVMSLAVVAVVERDDWRREKIVEGLGSLCAPDRVRFFDMPRVEISSSLIRSRARAGEPIRYLVPDKVANYVGAQSLYGASVPASGHAPGPAPQSGSAPAPGSASGSAPGSVSGSASAPRSGSASAPAPGSASAPGSTPASGSAPATVPFEAAR
jgi:nicotinate-nucleotide adenylyltransferase